MLTLQRVTKSYWVGKQQQTVLDGVDLDIEAAAFTALVGPSGSGKSTLLNLCGLVDRPDSGRVVWQGRDITEASAAELTHLRRQHIGFVFQSFNLIPVMTVTDNVAFPLLLNNVGSVEISRRVSTLLDAVGLADQADKKPGDLSGGQRQRVAIARALIKQPALIVADEPTANLDQDTALTVIDLMRNLSREYRTAVVVATHDDRLLSWCDHAQRVDHGKLTAIATGEREAVL